MGNKRIKAKKKRTYKSPAGNNIQVFKVQIDVTGSTILLYNRNKSILVQDDASRYEEDFLNRLKRNGRVYVIMRVYPDRLHFLDYTGDKGW